MSWNVIFYYYLLAGTRKCSNYIGDCLVMECIVLLLFDGWY